MIGDAEFTLELLDVGAKSGGVDGIALGGEKAGDAAAEVVVEGDERSFAHVLADHGREGDGEMFFAPDLEAEFGVADAVGTAGGGLGFALDRFLADDFAEEVVIAIAPAVLVADDQTMIVAVRIPEGAEEPEGEFRKDEAFILVLFDESVVARGGDDLGPNIFELNAGRGAASFPALRTEFDIDRIGLDRDGVMLFYVPGFAAKFDATFWGERSPEFLDIFRMQIHRTERAENAAFESPDPFVRLMDFFGIGDMQAGIIASRSIGEDLGKRSPDFVRFEVARKFPQGGCNDEGAEIGCEAGFVDPDQEVRHGESPGLNSRRRLKKHEKTG